MANKHHLALVVDEVADSSSDSEVAPSSDTPDAETGAPSEGGSVTDYELITNSGAFDANWYLQSYRDVAQSGLDPVDHYLRYGAAESRNPSPRFITAQYLLQHGALIPQGMNPLVHYILHGRQTDLIDVGMLEPFHKTSISVGLQRLDAFPLFSVDDYVSLNADLAKAGGNCLNHAMVYGFSEGRQVFRRDSVARTLGAVSREPIVAPVLMRPKTRKLPRVGVFYNTEGNGFIRDLAADLVKTLGEAGQDAVLLNERSDPSARPTLCIFMGPHEFFHLGAGAAWATDDIVRNAVMFNTEQPQTLWFERGMPFNLLSAGVIDICYQISRMFRAAGMPAIHFNPHLDTSDENSLTKEDQQHPMFKVLPKTAQLLGRHDSPLTSRPIDVSFFGTASAHREAFFLKAAPFLATRECFIYYRKFEGPLILSDRDDILSRLPRHVAKHSKITLNIHRDDFGFFEWHRIAKLGMACGSVIVSEPCLPHPRFKPDVHFFEETSRQIPNLIEWILNSPEGARRAQETRNAVASLLKDKTAARQSAKELICFLAEVTEARS